MLRSGFELAERVLSFPTPVVMACTGHAVAMGVFLLVSGDTIIGTAGPYKITANEVAIGLTLPWAAIEILRNRLTPADFARAANLAEVYSPEAAVAAGFLDRVVAADELHAAARETATALAAARHGRARRHEAAHARTGPACPARRDRRRVRRLGRLTPSDGPHQAAHAGAPRPVAPGRGRHPRRRRGGRVHHPPGRVGCRHLAPRRLRALRRQGRPRARGLLRGLPPPPRRPRRPPDDRGHARRPAGGARRLPPLRPRRTPSSPT